MPQQMPYENRCPQELDKAMKPEQFTQVIEAILEGKYSWACVLILRFAGYNPLHYIPYRTYNRIVKDNTRSKQQSSSPPNSGTAENYKANINSTARRHLHAITDLSHLTPVPEETIPVRGGYCPISHVYVSNTIPRDRIMYKFSVSFRGNHKMGLL